MLEKEILSEATFKAKTIIMLQVTVAGLFNIKSTLAEGNCVAETLGRLTLGKEVA